MIGIFPDRGLRWRHFRGDGITSSAQDAPRLGSAGCVMAGARYRSG